MAHSNRKKIKAARGGKTRHQMLKAMRESKYSSGDKQARIKELEAWQQELDSNRGKVFQKETTSSRKRRISKMITTKERRERALHFLESQLLLGTKTVNEHTPEMGTIVLSQELSQEDRKRIEAEIKTLKDRI